MNPEKINRRKGREAERSLISKGRKPRGRQRLYLVLSAAGLAATFLGGIGLYEYSQSDNYVIGSEIRRLGVEKDQKEIDLWLKVDQDIAQNAQSGTLTPAKKLNFITGAMADSDNPFYRDSAKFLVDQKNIGRIGTAIDPKRFPDNAIINSSVEVTPDGNLGIGMDVSVPAMLEMGSQEMASGLSHEVKHIEDAFEADKPVENKPIGERIENQGRRIKDPNELLAEEARGYMQQAESIIYELGLMGENDYSAAIKRSFTKTGVDTIVNAARAKGNASAPSWKNFLRRAFSIN